MRWAIFALVAILLYNCLGEERTVNYYINHSAERATKIRTCQENRDTSDRCMNAYTAQRTIMQGLVPPR